MDAREKIQKAMNKLVEKEKEKWEVGLNNCYLTMESLAEKIDSLCSENYELIPSNEYKKLKELEARVREKEFEIPGFKL